MSLVDLIKQIGTAAVDSQHPVAMMFGAVTQEFPLEVSVNQRITLTRDFLIVPETLREQRITIGGTEYLIRKPLQQGEKVALLRVQGGLSYYVLDRVVDE
ncbi:DUF2577 domain-containing protein [Paenibacillus sp. GCM10012307]|uniref:DUF2577 domain-containing protein n=1 Tax=Paenibacillus roseus TaxID=2798579 RepID=A0A934MUA4_9BACL|nr:DUF2577 domain-containing protein [Paenibacillus roseus]MBJ6360882.1 DUF2577 domain-containing protein [Paenibacillus roseus]